MLIARRNLMGGKPLPYDAEVEWIEGASNGSAFISTGFDLRDGYILDCTIIPIKSHTSGTAYGVPSGTACSWLQLIEKENGWECNIGGGFSTIVDSKELHIKHFFEFTSGNSRICNVQINGQQISRSSSTNPGSDLNLRLISPSRNGYSVRMSHAKIESIISGKVIDLIPVRVGPRENGVGYMFDRVSGQLFRNEGTGAFVIGPDKTV